MESKNFIDQNESEAIPIFSPAFTENETFLKIKGDSSPYAMPTFLNLISAVTGHVVSGSTLG